MFQNGLMMTSLGYVWDVDLPYVVTRVEQGRSGNCGATGGFTSFQATNSLDIGTKLHTPGSGERDLGATAARAASGSPDLADYIPSSFAGYSGPNLKATRDLWIAKCEASSNFKRVIGHEVKAPNGDTYTFDHVKTYSTTFSFVRPPNGPSSFRSSIDVDNVYMFPTTVTDVHGNWVKYQYNAHGVTRIWSNDGREIRINDSGALISSVVANGRQWDYTYNSSGDRLSRIDLPDDETYWSFGDGTGMSNNGMLDADCAGKRFASDQRTMIIRHPSGTVGRFETGVIFNPVRHVPNKPYTSSVGLGASSTACSWGSLSPKLFMSRALLKKTLTLDTGETRVWTYDYHQSSGTWGQYGGSKHFFSPDFDLGHAADAPTEYDIKKRTVIDPLGHKQVYHINVDWLAEFNGQYKVGGLIRQEKFATATSTTPLQVISHDSYDAYQAIGGHATYRNRIAKSEFHFLPSGKSVTQDGDTYTSKYVYNMDPRVFNFGHTSPIQTTKYSNISSTPRIVNTVFFNDYSNWVLGLADTESINGRTIVDRHFTSKSQISSVDKFGVGAVSYFYNPDGTVQWVKDALNRQITLQNWKRGKPQSIRRPDSEYFLQTVDDNGWVTSTTDPNNNTTGYAHNPMGWLTLIDPPGLWAKTSVAYTFPNAGGVVQTITKGQSKETVTYDSLFRPTLERIQALDTGWSSYVNTEYDGLGRVIFTSQPSTNPSEIKGVNTTYDGLGRVYDITENVAPYAKTRHRYLNGHRHQVYDPSGAWTQYASYGYDGPGNKSYRHIYEYANGAYQRKTSIYRNIWGELTTVSQRGDLGDTHTNNQSQYFYYDAQRRLCRHYVPEHGATKYQYDAAGQMVAYAKGQSNSGCGTVPNGSAKVSQSYDLLGRPTRTNFYDPATPDIARTYDANGNLKILKRGSGSTLVKHQYSYNDMNMLVLEKLDIDGRNYDMTYRFNTSGFLTRRTYNFEDATNNRYVNYTVDGLGRIQTVKDGSAFLASNTDFHPNSRFSDMTYGNGVIFGQDLNSRLQTSRLHAYSGATAVIDQTLSYDARGLVTSIIDGAVSGNNRTYGYDGLGQLKTASGPWGAGSYTYDSLGNLRRKQLGARTVTLNYDASKNRLSQSIDTGSSGTRTVAYDGRGNVTTLGNLTFLYDMSDQPTVVSGAANGNYTYDGNFKRVKAVVNSKTIYNVYDASGGLVHIDAVTDAKRTDYVSGPMGPLARITNGTVTYLHPDHLGSAQIGTKSSGAAAWREQYTPFGEELQSPAANDNLGGFTGHIKDSATGLNYMQARYYDPVIGRFLSIDAMQFNGRNNPAFFNRYAYTFNDPINLIDPDGNAPNKAGATDWESIKKNISSNGNLSGLSGNGGNTGRYFHTGTYGWVDPRHFGKAAEWTAGPATGGMVKILGVGLEIKQSLFEFGKNGYKSGFSPEDIPSNSAGVAFARFSSKYMKANSGASLADAFGVWATKEGALIASSEGYQSSMNGLPATDPSVGGGAGRDSNSSSNVGPNSSVKANSSTSASTSNSAANSNSASNDDEKHPYSSSN